MPLNPNIKKVLIIGSGPIIIGQAAEFDYAGSQACRALRDAGLTVVLINSNPATIMTDSALADRVYIEPLTPDTIKRVIEIEKPDGVVSTLGGQNGLTLSMQLKRDGFLDAHGVKLLGAGIDTIEKAEDRPRFKQTMEAIDQPCVPSEVVTDVEAAVAFANGIGYPVIVRPAYTLGGTGGGIAGDERSLREIAQNGIRLSPIGQILVERCISGWKEIEFEVMRDAGGSAITVCSMENLDPVGVHTGDSIVIAPAVTLADKEYQMLRTAALRIVSELQVEGGCNCQFALHPESREYAVIEVNPRVSRSSALASKATGYPIAKTAALIAVGFTLGELTNAVTGATSACFEPAIDYVVVKLPKWPFDKFVYARRTLGTQMMATGEVMAIAPSFEQAIMKAVRGAEIGMDTLTLPAFAAEDDAKIHSRLYECTDERLFAMYEALRRGISVDEIHRITMVDEWFLNKLKKLVDAEDALRAGPIDQTAYLRAKRMGFLDATIERLTGHAIAHPRLPVYKMVDTCAAEFEAQTPYFYATYDDENEAAEFLARRDTGKQKVIVFGSGPIRIGQGIEFDYASVHCVWTLKRAGYEVILVNNNPETVSTDFDTADRLYFEPLNIEDVMGVIATERPYGVVVAFGGQTAIKLTQRLHARGIKILGTSADMIDAAEDRERFDAMLQSLRIERPAGTAVINEEQALAAAQKLGFPVLMRPSYVLGGQNMIIAYNEGDIREYMKIILAGGIENPILIDQYLSGVEAEVDVICDGRDVLIPGVMEHIERAGVHSGDSIAVYPAWNLNGVLTQRLIECSRALALALSTRGLINIQYVIHQNAIYVIEANPRASRTIPYLSKVTGVPMVELAVRCMMGERLRDMGYGTGLYRRSPYYAVKVPAFSFEKLTDVDTHLGPEMKSTGEVLGIGRTLEEALYKGLVAAGYKMERRGGVLISVRDQDKAEIVDTARKFADLDCPLYATRGTARALMNAGLDVTPIARLSERPEEALKLIDDGSVQYVISTSNHGRNPSRGSVRMRRRAVERAVPCLTSIDTANAL
ncbi:MAG: carbamoyl-phosphate synthase large subunit, partial [Clostridiales bacterium]|nr:carbamoyl-phosphate synthase large subunit [Clostridiales bacterium]